MSLVGEPAQYAIRPVGAAFVSPVAVGLQSTPSNCSNRETRLAIVRCSGAFCAGFSRVFTRRGEQPDRLRRQRSSATRHLLPYPRVRGDPRRTPAPGSRRSGGVGSPAPFSGSSGVCAYWPRRLKKNRSTTTNATAVAAAMTTAAYQSMPRSGHRPWTTTLARKATTNATSDNLSDVSIVLTIPAGQTWLAAQITQYAQ
jgi:hypothetical protein